MIWYLMMLIKELPSATHSSFHPITIRHLLKFLSISTWDITHHVQANVSTRLSIALGNIKDLLYEMTRDAN